jgi:hypothetical protein
MVADVAWTGSAWRTPRSLPYTDDVELDLGNLLHQQVKFLNSQENVALARAGRCGSRRR